MAVPTARTANAPFLSALYTVYTPSNTRLKSQCTHTRTAPQRHPCRGTRRGKESVTTITKSVLPIYAQTALGTAWDKERRSDPKFLLPIQGTVCANNPAETLLTDFQSGFLLAPEAEWMIYKRQNVLQRN